MKNEAIRERKEKLNKIFWNNLDFEGIEHGTFERPVKAKIQGEIEDFIESEIEEAVAKERERIIEIVRKSRTVGEAFGIGLAEDRARYRAIIDIIHHGVKSK